MWRFWHPGFLTGYTWRACNSNRKAPIVAQQPHIIIFNPDQWRGDVLGHMGNPAAITPHLDEIIEEDAVSFRNAFCQNPVCTPSRCSFMTGWYPHTRGHRTMFHMLHGEHNETNLLRLLKENGYHVWWGGKNDLIPGHEGFEDHCDVKFNATDEDYARWGYTPRPHLHGEDAAWRGEPGQDRYYSFYAGQLDKGDDDVYCDNDHAMILGAVDHIRNYEGDKPLCIYLPIGAPHPPYGVEEPWFSAIDRDKLPPRTPKPEGWKDKPSLLSGLSDNFGLQNWTEEEWTELRATYYGMCARVDHQFGMVVDALKESDRYDDSAVFLFSDHGDFTGDYELVEKTQNTFEDCLSRVPFVIKPPKGTALKSGVHDGLVELVDFSATVFEMTGIDPGYDAFGKSLLPALAGKDPDTRDAVFCEGGRLKGEKQAMELGSTAGLDSPRQSQYWPRLDLQHQDDKPYHTKAAMCRTRNFKYVRRHYEQDELYDLKQDPQELHNIVNDPAYGDVLNRLRERLLTWYMETCDVVPRVEDSRF
jgi:arylsulfatase A-like enzyme